jgi:hypothetical protein
MRLESVFIGGANAVAHVQEAVLPRPRMNAVLTSAELRRKVDLIEVRPEETLTWSDAADFVRSIKRSLEAIFRRLPR